MQQLPILKKWIEEQFIKKDWTGKPMGVIKASIDKDAYTLKIREDNVDDGTYTRYNTYFEGDKIRITNGGKQEYFTLLEKDGVEYVCYQKGELWDKNTTRWTILSMEKVTTTEGYIFKKERIIGYDINLDDAFQNVAPCIGLMMGDFKIKF